MFRVYKKSVFVFLLLLLFWVNLSSADNYATGSSCDSLFEESLVSNNLENAVSFLLQESIPVPLIISKFQTRGFADKEIVNALLKTQLLREEIVFYVFQSHIPSDIALGLFEENGIGQDYILDVLVSRDVCQSRIIATCQYMVDRGKAKIDVLQMLTQAGADQDTVVKTGTDFQISPATITSVYQEAKEVPSEFGHAFTIQSEPQPALVSVGISRITGGDAFLNDPGDEISPSKP